MDVQGAFIKEASEQGLEIRRTLPDGTVVVAMGEDELTVSLENIRRNVGRDGDPGAIRRFVSTLRASLGDLPRWAEARSGIRFSLEPSNHEFGDTLRDDLTEEVTRVLVWVTPDERQIRWLDAGDLKRWGSGEPWLRRSQQRI